MTGPGLENPAGHIARLRIEIGEALSQIISERAPTCPLEVVQYALLGNGKRFRPVLLLLVAESFGAPREKAMQAAAAMEILHTFTLVHDDIMDRTTERRGRPTVWHRWDTDTALLCGDYLIALAFRVAARLGGESLPAITDLLFAACEQLYAGQSREKMLQHREHVSVRQYFKMVDLKTGALLQASLEMGGVLGGASEGQRRRLRSIGRRAGRGFQIQDDLLDLTAQDQAWGKPVGSDLASGKRSFPLLRALERATGEDRAWFQGMMNAGGLSASQLAEACERMTRLNVLQDTQNWVRRLTFRAQQDLTRLFPDSKASAIQWLLTQMTMRSS